MDTKALREHLERALNGAPGLSACDIESISVLIWAGEWEIALENLCTQISEYDIEISDESRELISDLGRHLHVQTDRLL